MLKVRDISRGWWRSAGAALMCLALVMPGYAQTPAAASNEAADSPHCRCAVNALKDGVNELLGCFYDPRCGEVKSQIAVALRAHGYGLGEAMRGYAILLASPEVGADQKEEYRLAWQQSRASLKALKKAIPFRGYEEQVDPLVVDFDDYEANFHRYYYRFSIGFEYISINSLFQTGVPRIGFLVYRRYSEVPEMHEGFGFYGVHFSGGLLMTSSAEAQINDKTAKGNVENTLEVTAEVFVPVLHSIISLDRSSTDYMGFMAAYGAKKTDTDAQISSRGYFGIRNILNPETYVDILLGRTVSVSKQRLEIRGQLPVYKFVHGSRIYLGGIMNTRVPWSSPEDSRDVLRFYLTWNVELDRILGLFSTAM
ncbi:MAG: hypothetical protein AABY83_01505 [Pseudomonadota bacterium]